jgi:hypothetical protein
MIKPNPIKILSLLLVSSQAVTAVMVCIDATMKVYDNIKTRVDKKSKKNDIGFRKNN